MMLHPGAFRDAVSLATMNCPAASVRRRLTWGDRDWLIVGDGGVHASMDAVISNHGCPVVNRTSTSDGAQDDSR